MAPQKFFGLEFDRQTLVLAGGALVAAVALSSVFRSRLPLQTVAAAAPFPIDLFAQGILDATESGARAAQTGVSTGGQIAVAGLNVGEGIADRGLDLAGRVVEALERVTETQTVSLSDAAERAIGGLERVATTIVETPARGAVGFYDEPFLEAHDTADRARQARERAEAEDRATARAEADARARAEAERREREEAAARRQEREEDRRRGNVVRVRNEDTAASQAQDFPVDQFGGAVPAWLLKAARGESVSA